MANELFSTFAPILRDLTKSDLLAEIEQPKKLLIASDTIRSRRIDVAYAAFDHVNQDADVVIVGLTPGRQQMRNGGTQRSRSDEGGKDIRQFFRSNTSEPRRHAR
jgi:hypothetical protein